MKNQTDTQYDWQARQITKACANCAFFKRHSKNSASGTCQCETSYFWHRETFKDNTCACWEAANGQHATA